MSETPRLRRAREQADRQLLAFEFGPSYPVHDGDKTLHLHVDCARCAASVRIEGRNTWLHWRTHHRLRAWVIEFIEQRRRHLSTESAKPVSSFETFMTESRKAPRP